MSRGEYACDDDDDDGGDDDDDMTVISHRPKYIHSHPHINIHMHKRTYRSVPFRQQPRRNRSRHRNYRQRPQSRVTGTYVEYIRIHLYTYTTPCSYIDVHTKILIIKLY